MRKILLHVLPRSILPFALTCKCNYQISLSVLNRQITLTDVTLLRFYSVKVVPRDRSLFWVRDIKISGTWALDRLPSLGRVNPFMTLLSSLPLLRSIDVGELHGAISRRKPVQDILRTLPKTMESIVMKITSPYDWDVTSWTRTVC